MSALGRLIVHALRMIDRENANHFRRLNKQFLDKQYQSSSTFVKSLEHKEMRECRVGMDL